MMPTAPAATRHPPAGPAVPPGPDHGTVPATGTAVDPGTVVDPATGACPLPVRGGERVTLGHGSGGQLSAELLHDVVLPALGPAAQTGPPQDAALLPCRRRRLVVSTDAYVVHPLFFPGGDIGSLAVHGSVNDVAMRAGEPLALTLAFVIEEGLEIATLARVAESVGRAAHAVGIPVLAGDTKVVDRGAADGLYLATTAIGSVLPGARVAAQYGHAGDAVVLSGPIGRHGTTVLSTREHLGFEADIRSDSQPLHDVVRAMVRAGGTDVRTLRDPTRGGLASALVELAAASGVGVEVDETAVPVPGTVAAACELLGLDPWHVANEGCLVGFVAPGSVDAVLAAMRELPESADATVIGRLTDDHPGQVVLRTAVGSRRVVDMLVGEQLPRIC